VQSERTSKSRASKAAGLLIRSQVSVPSGPGGQLYHGRAGSFVAAKVGIMDCTTGKIIAPIRCGDVRSLEKPSDEGDSHQ
jgi:hypothetical protein